MRAMGRIVWHSYRVTLASGANLAFFVLTATLVLSGFLGMMVEVSQFERAYASQSTEAFTAPLAPVSGGSAHQSVGEAVTYRFIHSLPPLGGALLPFRLVMPGLGLFLPLAAFILAFASMTEERESGHLESLLALPLSTRSYGIGSLLGRHAAGLTTLLASLFVGGMGCLLLYSRTVAPEHVARLGIMAGIITLYLSFFMLLGSWISLRARHSDASLRICSVVLVLVLATSAVASNARGVGTFARLPNSPVPPDNVVAYLDATASIHSSARPSHPPDVERYLWELRRYAESLHSSLRERYQLERWWNALSPLELLQEIGGQLLQDEYATVTDVFDIHRDADPSTSIGQSLHHVLPECIWLAVLTLAALVANLRGCTRLEV